MATDEVYQVERIETDQYIDPLNQDLGRLWLIKWSGYDESHNTWEPKQHLHHLDIWREYEKQKGKNKKTKAKKSLKKKKKTKKKKHKKHKKRDINYSTDSSFAPSTLSSSDSNSSYKPISRKLKRSKKSQNGTKKPPPKPPFPSSRFESESDSDDEPILKRPLKKPSKSKTVIINRTSRKRSRTSTEYQPHKKRKIHNKTIIMHKKGSPLGLIPKYRKPMAKRSTTHIEPIPIHNPKLHDIIHRKQKEKRAPLPPNPRIFMDLTLDSDDDHDHVIPKKVNTVELKTRINATPVTPSSEDESEDNTNNRIQWNHITNGVQIQTEPQMTMNHNNYSMNINRNRMHDNHHINRRKQTQYTHKTLPMHSTDDLYNMMDIGIGSDVTSTTNTPLSTLITSNTSNMSTINYGFRETPRFESTNTHKTADKRKPQTSPSPRYRIKDKRKSASPQASPRAPPPPAPFVAVRCQRKKRKEEKGNEMEVPLICDTPISRSSSSFRLLSHDTARIYMTVSELMNPVVNGNGDDWFDPQLDVASSTSNHQSH